MSEKNLTIKLTDEQQKQFKDAIGKDITELNLGLAAEGQLSEAELGQVQGGSFDAYLIIDGSPGESSPGPFSSKSTTLLLSPPNLMAKPK